MYSTDTKQAARQIVRESLDQILANTYEVPSLDEMITILQRNFDYSFDEYKAKQRIRRQHLDWGNTQALDEVDRQRRKFDNELRVNLKVAALSTIDEIENLIRSLKHTITEWKVKNL